MRRHLALAMTVIALLTGLALARPPARRLYEYRQRTLDNGLEVISLEDFSCPIVAVQVWYHVGSKNEPPDRQGFAHMFEHLMFRGTENLKPEEHANLIRQVGGECNAFTAFDNTTYVQTVPSEQLELALWLEAERMAFLNVDQHNFDTERNVVEEELRMRILNAPYGTVPEKVLPVIFGRHPYGWTPGGQIEHLRAADLAEIKRFWGLFYVPNNATLVIVGAVMHAEAHRLAQRYFGWMPRCPDPPGGILPEPAQTEPRKITVKEDKGPVPLAGLAFRTAPLAHPDQPALQMLAEILGGGESSRLYRSVVKEQKLATAAMAAAIALEDDGLLAAGGLLANPLGDTDKLLAAVREQIKRMREELVSERELAKAKNQMLRDTVAESLTVNRKGYLLGEYAVLHGNLSEANRSLERIRAVTRSDIRRVARKYLAPQRATTVQVKPNLVGGMLGKLLGKNKDQQQATPDSQPSDAPPRRLASANRAPFQRPENFPIRPPVAPQAQTFVLPSAEQFLLDNGLKVLVVSNHEVPIVSMQLGLLCGAWTDLPQMQGLAHMTCNMMTKETSSFPAEELAEVLETFAIRLSARCDHDAASILASCLTEQADRAMSLLAEVVLHPTFPEEEYKLFAEQMRAELMVALNEPAYLADREFRRRLWGHHPYARSDSAELAELDIITPDDLRSWWGKHVRPDLAVLIVAGDLTAGNARQLAERYLLDWQAAGPGPEVEPAGLPQPAGTHIYLLDRPGSVQSQIRVGHLGINRSHHSWFNAVVLSQVFGGSATSRLNDAIRTKKGLTYGARGGFQARRFAGHLAVATSSKTRSTGEALQAVIDEIRKMQTSPASDQETAAAVSYLTGSFAGARETPMTVAEDLWRVECCGLPADYYARYLAGVAETTSPDLEQAAGQFFKPDELVIVVVGEAEKLKEGLEKIAPVTVVKLPPTLPVAKPSDDA